MIGEWERYSRDYSPKYEKLVINNNYSGSYLVISNRKKVGYTEFKKSQTTIHDGFISINLDGGLRLVLSAWGKLENQTSPKRLLGNMFFYNLDSGEWKLINSEAINYYSTQEKGFVEFANRVESIVGEIANKQVSPDAAR